jgi:nucleotide-binding universal stress UspA family protein
VSDSGGQPRDAAAHPHTGMMFRRILVAFDGSDGSRRALDAALALAREYSATLTTVTVQHHLPRYGATVGEVDEERQIADQQMHRLTREVQAHAAEHDMQVQTEVRLGHPAQEIVHRAQELDADLIVIGHSGHFAILDRFLGSTAEKISRHAPCSVLITR